jgi:integrase/recombinase XerD
MSSTPERGLQTEYGTSRQSTADIPNTPQPEQPTLFTVDTNGKLTPGVALMRELTPEATLTLGRYWFRRFLEQSGHPKNTIESYSYDLALFEERIGPKPVTQISARDIAAFLGDSSTRSTRKRRLTSLNTFFKFLIVQCHLITEKENPAAGFSPEHIPLKTPQPLFADEQERFLAAAAEENERSTLIAHLLLRLGLTRGELLTIRKEHVDLSDPERPIVYIYYDAARYRNKERKLAADAAFAEDFTAYIAAYDPQDRLIALPPQSINKIVERIAAAAEINKKVTPQSLRDTWAVERAREGNDAPKLIALLGLAEDSRNKMSVERYIKLASPALS